VNYKIKKDLRKQVFFILFYAHGRKMKFAASQHAAGATGMEISSSIPDFNNLNYLLT